jgi:hypothetical protein
MKKKKKKQQQQAWASFYRKAPAVRANALPTTILLHTTLTPTLTLTLTYQSVASTLSIPMFRVKAVTVAPL